MNKCKYWNDHIISDKNLKKKPFFLLVAQLP